MYEQKMDSTFSEELEAMEALEALEQNLYAGGSGLTVCRLCL